MHTAHSPSDPPARNAPLVLLAEDDRSSRIFLSEALCNLGCDVDSCADGPTAIALCRRQTFDLLLLDCFMPNGGADYILDRLRRHPEMPSAGAPVIATTADLSETLRQQLLDAGCLGVIEKPLTLKSLSHLVKAVLPPRYALALLDDERGMATSGNADTMRELRRLFVAELRQLDGELDELALIPAQLSERLHRLRAACGFCGAVALSREALKLRFVIEQKHAIDAERLNALRTCLLDTARALEQRIATTRASG